jgi:hypothetical protein
MRNIGRRIGLVGVVVFIAALIWAGWYVYNKGFSRKWRRVVAEEFRKRGLEVSLRRLTLDPLRGLIARDVRIVDERDKDRVLAFIDQVVLEINYANVFSGELFLKAFDLRDANIALPIDPGAPGEDQLRITGLNARVVLPPGQVLLDRAEANLYGVRVVAQGQLVNAQSYQPPPRDDARKAREIATLRRVIAELSALRFEGGQPEMRIKFSGDVAKPETLFASASFLAPKMTRGQVVLHELSASGDYRKGVLTIDHVTAKDHAGSLAGSGEFHPDSGELRMEARSSLDIRPWAEWFGVPATWRDFSPVHAPAVDVRAEITAAGEKKVYGRIDMGAFTMRGIQFEHFESDFAWTGKGWFVHGLRLTHRSGELTMDVMRSSEGLRISLRNGMDVKAIEPWTPSAWWPYLRAWEFQQPPRVHLEITQGTGGEDPVEATGRVELGRSAFRGVTISSGSGAVSFRGALLEMHDIVVETPYGQCSGQVACDFAKQETRFDGTAVMQPAVLSGVLAPDLSGSIGLITWSKPPVVNLRGSTPFTGVEGRSAEGDVQAPEGFTYTFRGKKYPVTGATARVTLVGDRLEFPEFHGGVLGGNVSGSASVTPGEWKLRMAIADVDLERFVEVSGVGDSGSGTLSGKWNATGSPANAAATRGDGSVQVRGENLLGIAPFRGLKKVVADNPLMEAEKPRELSVTGEFDDGVLKIGEMIVRAPHWRLEGRGSWTARRDRLKLRLHLKTEVPGFTERTLVTDGTFAQPNWRWDLD